MRSFLSSFYAKDLSTDTAFFSLIFMPSSFKHLLGRVEDHWHTVLPTISVATCVLSTVHS
jgi:hypothetical protein